MADPADPAMPARPLWAVDDRHRPPLQGTVAADVVVVGGGIAGLTTAVLLARSGARVCVVEAGSVGQGTTGASTAKVTALQATRLSEIRRAHGAGAVVAYVQAQLAAQDWVRERAGDRATEVEAEARAAVTSTTDPARTGDIEAEAKLASEAGLPVELVDAVPDLPFPVAAAVRLAGQFQIDPRRWAEDLALELDATPGAVVHEGSRVLHVDPRGRSVATEHGEVRADHIVVATLLPITDRGAFFARSSPAMSHAIAVAVEGDTPVLPMSFGIGTPSRSLRDAPAPDGSRRVVVGGEGHGVGREPHALDREADLERWARQHFDVAEVTHRWAAHDLRPVDELPFAGKADRLPGAPWVATGFAKWGMANATAAAMTIAGRILGTAARPWDDAFDPQRHHGLTGLGEAARINASVARELAWGWARPAASTTPTGPAVGRRHGAPCATAPGEGDSPCGLSLVCTHLGGIVRWNEAAGTWDCPLHGSRFDADGTVVAGPASRPLSRHEPTGCEGQDRSGADHGGGGTR